MPTSSGQPHQRHDADQNAESAVALVEMSAGYWLPRALQIVADLGVADALHDEPRSAADLAARLGANPDALNRVLRLLASHGVFERVAGKYAHNARSLALRSDHPQSMRAYVRMLGMPLFWDSWGGLERTVRSGEPAVQDIFGYFREHPAEWEIFNDAMKAKAQSAIPPLLAAYDFSAFPSIGDIGGGLGHLLKAVLKASPRSRGVLFDQPQVVEHLERDGELGDRLTSQGGDFFRGPLPKCGAYLVMEVLHDWTDDQSRQILRQIRAAAPNSAKLLVIETVLPNESAWAAGPARHFGHHLDITMLVLTGGRERTADEFAELFTDSGWRFSRVIPTAGAYSIVEATVA